MLHTRASLASIPFFFFNDTATTEIYTLSLHDGSSDLSSTCTRTRARTASGGCAACSRSRFGTRRRRRRSEEHTSELQSQSNLVCRLLLEKKRRAQRQNSNDSLFSNAIYCSTLI